ncbi:MAG: hypothetical protein ACXWCY_17610 [Burkholderiales bacterium]
MSRGPRLMIRRTIRSMWIWELLTDDSHVVNRSEREFATRYDCVLDAKQNGFEAEQKSD